MLSRLANMIFDKIYNTILFSYPLLLCVLLLILIIIYKLLVVVWIGFAVFLYGMLWIFNYYRDSFEEYRSKKVRFIVNSITVISGIIYILIMILIADFIHDYY